ncbi:unnamed protein product [Amoebophrya sp. A25]|nr:unnamed protein product [Amoebophrya sp. A25]|eukprot:GSA25T00004939001.1
MGLHIGKVVEFYELQHKAEAIKISSAPGEEIIAEGHGLARFGEHTFNQMKKLINELFLKSISHPLWSETIRSNLREIKKHREALAPYITKMTESTSKKERQPLSNPSPIKRCPETQKLTGLMIGPLLETETMYRAGKAIEDELPRAKHVMEFWIKEVSPKQSLLGYSKKVKI